MCREALLRMAGGPEEFLAMRSTFWASLAASCVTGYIAGCGDRHLENFLLHSSGSVIPIDFGYAHKDQLGKAAQRRIQGWLRKTFCWH